MSKLDILLVANLVVLAKRSIELDSRLVLGLALIAAKSLLQIVCLRREHKHMVSRLNCADVPKRMLLLFSDCSCMERQFQNQQAKPGADPELWPLGGLGHW